MKNENVHIIVVGAGASGLLASIAAAEAGAKVTVLEQKEKAGKKLLATGNGHCNFTNDRMDVSCYHGNAAAMQVLESFSVKQTLDFFRRIGIFPHERNGYYYPVSEQAAAVVSLLLKKAVSLGVTVLTGARVERIEKNAPGEFQVSLRMAVKNPEAESRIQSRNKQLQKEKSFKKGKSSSKDRRLQSEQPVKKGSSRQGGFRNAAEEICYENRILYADKVILACGGMASPVLGSDGSGYTLARSMGHRVISPLPALTGISCRESWFKKLAGVRVSARVTLFSQGCELASDAGELQLTDYGISGIPVFQVSRYASKALAAGQEVQAELCFFPEIEENDLKTYLMEHDAGEYNGLYPSKLLAVLEEMAEVRREVEKTEALLHLTRHLLCNCREVNGWERAQVTCGGVPLDEVNLDTMESLCCPGLYLAGELLDVDGICGGYNLQWAWSSGHLAGENAAFQTDRSR